MTYGRVGMTTHKHKNPWRGRKSFGRAGEGPLFMVHRKAPSSALRAPSAQGEKGPSRLRARAWGSVAVLVLLTSIALQLQAAACTVPEGFVRLASPEAEIAYRWEPERLEVGRFFVAEVIACRAPGTDAVREIILDAQMPAHGHGMNYRPTAVQLRSDRFRITGMMLHMAGRWRLTFDLVQGDRRTRLSQDVDLKP